MRSYVRLASRVFLLVVSSKSLVALDPALAASQYLHTSWTQEEGADLPAIQAIAQGSDGYLWLGASTGLIRFDGMRFVHWEPRAGEKLPCNDVRFLIASSHRGLWIGSALGISRLDHGRLTTYPAADRWLGGTVVAMLEDHLGRLWMLGQGAAGRSLGVLLPDDSFQIYGQKEGLPAQTLQTIFEDRQHVFWVGTSKGLCRWSPGSQADCLSIPAVNVWSLVEEANGDLLIGDDVRRTTMRLSHGALQPLMTPPGYASVVPKVTLRDHNGAVWIGTFGQGLLRLRNGLVEKFTRRDGLSSDMINSLSEDREGDLWIGTARGIDRFRDPKVVHLSSFDGLSGDLVTAVYAARQGGAWVGTSEGGLNHVTATHITRYPGISKSSKTVLSLYEEPGGKLWVATTAGLAHNSGNRFIQVRDTDGRPLDRVFAISGQNDGSLALADGKMGIFTVQGEVARPLIVPGLQKRGIYQLQFDRSGVLWIGYFQGGIAAVTGNSFRLYTTSDGLGTGPVRAIYQDAAGDIWVGTGTGLSRFRNGLWTTWTARNGLPEGGVRGIVEDGPLHALWLISTGGLLRVSMADLDSARASTKPLPFLLYGRNDGLRLAASGSMVNPPIARSDDGRIWLCTQDGVAIVDPARLRSNPVPPPVVIEQVVVDGTPLDLTSTSRVEFRGRQLQIAYTALSLMVPERIRFKYQLEGFDHNWTEAEGRRNVAYVNLPSRAYRFRVIACNNDGVWNNEGAALAFLVKPYFYQTWWFAALCINAVGLLAWGAHLLRVRRVVTRMQLIAQERARLMRELHDSLLQGFVGVVYQLEAVARQFETAPDISKKRLERAIEQADHSLQEARRTMLSMRLPALENSTLPEALSTIATQLTREASIAFSLEVKGRVQQLPYDQQANVYLIGREAITNSVNHARASRIAAALIYSHKELRLTVQDDGSGFDPQAGTAKPDHWGMRGMRERANSIGAELVLDAAPGRGTKIEIVVPRKG
jgi:signal transduction histidine kinase/ligand-binding sensor domain-containing protein